MFTPEEIKTIKESEVYQYYANIDFATVSYVNIVADLDAIQKCSLENLPIIRYLKLLLKLKTDEMIDGSQQTAISNITNAVNKVHYNVSAALNPLNKAPAAGTPGTVTDFSVHHTEATLVAGALANHPLYQPGAGQKAFIMWVLPGVVDAGQENVNYTLHFTDEDDNTMYACNWVGRNNTVIPIHATISTADKDFNVDILGGAGVEVLEFLTCAGKYS